MLPTKSVLEHHCILSCTTMTTDLHSVTSWESLFLPDSNYHMIYGLYGQGTMQHGWDIIQQILLRDLAKDKIVDITLPLQLTLSHSPENILSRVIIFKRNIIGIRILNKQKKNRGAFKQYELPLSMRGICENSSCPIGQFFLMLKNTKIALLFEKQVSHDILHQYHGVACQIFCVVGQLSFQQKEMDGGAIQKLKSFTGSCKKTVIYCSPLGSASIQHLYEGKSFIGHLDKTMVQSELSVYEPSEVIAANINLLDVKAAASYPSDYPEDWPKLRFVEVPYNLKRKPTEIAPPRAKKQFIPSVVSRQIPKYYLWSVFKKFNKMNPFIISSLLTHHNLTIIHLIDKIAHEISSQNYPAFEDLHDNSYQSIINRMLKICDYRCVPQPNEKKHEVLTKVRKALEAGKNIFKSVPIESEDGLCEFYQQFIGSQRHLYNCLCIYSDVDAEIHAVSQVAKNFINEEILLFRKSLKKVDCNRMFNIQQIYGINTYEFQPSQQFGQQEQKIEKSILEAHGQKLLFIRSLEKQFRNIETIQKLDMKVIPKVIKRFAADDELTDFYINTNHQERKPIFEQMLSRDLKEISFQNMEEDNQKKDISNIGEKLERIKNIKKTKFYNCHICSQPYERYLGQLCRCKAFYCIDCLKEGPSAETRKIVQSCNLCKSKCQCNKCKENLNKLENQLKKECHYCLINKKVLVNCHKVTCQTSFCTQCFQKLSMGQKPNVMALKDWDCFLCRELCTCTMCKLEQKKQKERANQYMLALMRTNSQASEAMAQPVQTQVVECVVSKYINPTKNNFFEPVHGNSQIEESQQKSIDKEDRFMRDRSPPRGMERQKSPARTRGFSPQRERSPPRDDRIFRDRSPPRDDRVFRDRSPPKQDRTIRERSRSRERRRFDNDRQDDHFGQRRGRGRGRGDRGRGRGNFRGRSNNSNHDRDDDRRRRSPSPESQSKGRSRSRSRDMRHKQASNDNLWGSTSEDPKKERHRESRYDNERDDDHGSSGLIIPVNSRKNDVDIDY